MTLSCLPCALFCSCPCKVCSRVSDALSQALCNLSLAFLGDFTLSHSTAPTRFIVKLFSLANTLCFSFESKDKITAFTCLPSYRYTAGIPLLEAYLLPMAIIELAKNVSPKNVSPKNKMAASHVVQIHMQARFLRSKKWPTRLVAVPTGNTQASQHSIFRENRLKF